MHECKLTHACASIHIYTNQACTHARTHAHTHTLSHPHTCMVAQVHWQVDTKAMKRIMELLVVAYPTPMIQMGGMNAYGMGLALVGFSEGVLESGLLGFIEK